MISKKLAWAARRCILFVVPLWLLTPCGRGNEKFVAHVLPGEFSVARALKLLYGNYDPKSRTAEWKDFSVQKAEHDKGFQFCEHFESGNEKPTNDWAIEPISVAVLKSWRVGENGIAREFLVTWARPKGWDQGNGRQCWVIIGAATFSKVPNGWKLESSEKYLAMAGTYGFPPEDVKLVRIGLRKHGVFLTWGDLNQGYEGTVTKLIAPHGTRLVEMLRISVFGDNGGAVSDQAGCPPQYSYSVQLHFVAGKNPEYFDLQAVSKGTDVNEKCELVSADRTWLMRFENGAYVDVAPKKLK